MAADGVVRVDGGELGRLERGAAKAEASGKTIGKAANDAGRFAANLVNRLNRAAQLANRFAAGSGFESQAQAAADIAAGTAAGVRTGAAVIGAIPLPGTGALGATIGGVLGEELGRRLPAQRQATERARIAVENEARAFELRLEAQEKTAADAERARAESARRVRETTLGGGDDAAAARLRAAFRGRS